MRQQEWHLGPARRPRRQSGEHVRLHLGLQRLELDVILLAEQRAPAPNAKPISSIKQQLLPRGAGPPGHLLTETGGGDAAAEALLPAHATGRMPIFPEAGAAGAEGSSHQRRVAGGQFEFR